MAALLVLAEAYLKKDRHSRTRKYIEAILAIEPTHARATAINAALPPKPSVQTTTIRVGGVKYLVVRKRSEIHEHYQLHAKKHIRPSNHSTQRWLERVGPTDFLRGLASCFKLLLVKKVLIKDDGTRIYVSHKDVAFIVTKDNAQKKDYVLLTILTKADVADNPNKLWWFE